VEAGRRDIAAAARHSMAHGPLLTLRYVADAFPWKGTTTFESPMIMLYSKNCRPQCNMLFKHATGNQAANGTCLSHRCGSGFGGQAGGADPAGTTGAASVRGGAAGAAGTHAAADRQHKYVMQLLSDFGGPGFAGQSSCFTGTDAAGACLGLPCFSAHQVRTSD